jgi:hypothetical protein
MTPDSDAPLEGELLFESEVIDVSEAESAATSLRSAEAFLEQAGQAGSAYLSAWHARFSGPRR